MLCDKISNDRTASTLVSRRNHLDQDLYFDEFSYNSTNSANVRGNTISNGGCWQLLASSSDLQALMVLLGTGLVILGIAYRGFGKWMSSKKFSYTRPHVSRFARTAMLAFFGIGLVTGVNLYMQIEVMLGVGSDFSDEAIQTFEKIINTINILVIGYTISHLIPTAVWE